MLWLRSDSGKKHFVSRRKTSLNSGRCPHARQMRMGMDPAQASLEIAALRNLFFLLAYPLKVVQEWQSVVAMHKLSGKQTHDAYLVAMMHVHSV